jgi:hypothetical protein
LPNPGGQNSAVDLRPYGDVKKQTELTQSAPLSGAPVAGRAIDAARRAQRTAVRGRPQPAASGPAPAATPPVAPGAAPVQNTGQQGSAQRAAVWSALAATPGASGLVQFYAQQAQQEAQGAQTQSS